MREALARSNLDLIMAEEAAEASVRAKPARRPASSPARGAAKPAPAKSTRTRARPVRRWSKRPGRALAVATFVALLCGIAVNATLLQKGRHPAPLFASRESFARRPAPAAPQPQPPRRPLRAAPALEAPAPAERPALRAPAPSAPPRARSQASSADALGAFIVAQDQGVGRAERLYAAQAALRRLGFSIKATGRLDAATKTALERFAREHNLQATGDLTPSLARLLTARSGVRVP